VLLELAADIQASPDADLRAAQRELRTCAGVLGLRLNGDVES
jgi:hypothetical protein